MTDYKFLKKGDDVRIWPLAKIIGPEKISLGNAIIIDDFVLMSGGMSTTIGNFVHIASFSSVMGGGELVMEDFSGLSSGCRIYTGNEDYLGGSLTNPTVPDRYRKVTRSSLHIGKHAIIGANSVVLPGIRIGEGVAVGANSLVTKDCEPWTIYGGSPAKPIRKRPSERILELEAELRRSAFDAQGNYIPKRIRGE